MAKPTRADLARAAMHAAVAAGVRPLDDGAGLTGPRLPLYAYLERLRELGMLAQVTPPDPERAARMAHRQAVERWRRDKKRGKR